MGEMDDCQRIEFRDFGIQRAGLFCAEADNAFEGDKGKRFDARQIGTESSWVAGTEYSCASSPFRMSSSTLSLLMCTRYAMCDSPSGLLVFAMKGLSLLAPRMQFTPEQIITFANLAWLPGPEYAMRFWARCATEEEERPKAAKPIANRPKVAITVFLGGEGEAGGDESAAQEVGDGAIRLMAPLKSDMRARYTCPAWAKTHYNVLFSQRISGEPGLLAWERPEVITTGIRALVKELVSDDQRLGLAREEVAEPLAGVVVTEQTGGQAQDEGLKPPERPSLGHGDSSRTRVGSPEGGLKPPERPALEQGDSSRTQVGSQPPSSPKDKDPEASVASDDSKQQYGSEADTPRPGTPDTIVQIQPAKP